jgi:hypothetical protein
MPEELGPQELEEGGRALDLDPPFLLYHKLEIMSRKILFILFKNNFILF